MQSYTYIHGKHIALHYKHIKMVNGECRCCFCLNQDTQDLKECQDA